MTTPGFDKGAYMARVEDNLANPSNALTAVGVLAVAESQEAFRSQRFDGETWKPRRVPSVMGVLADFAAGKASPPARRFQSRPALTDTGALRRSIAYRVRGNSVEWGSNLSYAPLHQGGGETESPTITKALQDKLGRWLKGKGKTWLPEFRQYLNPKMVGKTKKSSVPARPFVGLTKSLEQDAMETIGKAIVGF